ncbi:hypothetical protein SAMD00019534_087320, partial [Acytostelium subglobosum LB1]|uniref:hypothetical protein n=1 Tax=Acytostelium subglobosum LB1 TaxID=1410327 RepID=UPI000644F38C
YNKMPEGSFIPFWLQAVVRFMAIYYIAMTIGQKFFGGAPDANMQANVTLTNGTQMPAAQVTIYNTWSMNTPFTMEVYLSESNTTVGDWLVWSEKQFIYGWDESNNREQNITFKTPDYLKNNGSLYAHVLVHNILSPTYSLQTVHPLIVYAPRPKTKGKNLLADKKEVVEEPIYDPNELVSYWKPSMIINLIVDNTAYGPGSIPPEMFQQFNVSGDRYSPSVFLNEFWLYKEHLSMVNETVDELTLTMSTYPLSFFKWQLYTQMQKSLDMQSMFGGGAPDQADTGDDFKRMLTDNNPYLLALTAVVTLLHTIFEFLAFKNDIQFWKNNKSMEGLSVRTIMLHTGCQAVVFLYLLDNDTSYMILFSAGFGLLLEIWKIGKAMNVTMHWRGIIPIFKFENKDSYVSKTKQYDDLAMKYLSWVLFPLVVGMSIYSLYYHEHKSWYSWVVSSLVRTVYTFEFIMMTPQLFINYKLKSVSALPFKVFMYRALNTFIDDLFAFIIKMPLMHRLSCLRDDIVFIVYLYQRWIYPVDLKRTHYGGEVQDDDVAPQLVENKPATAPAVDNKVKTSKKSKKVVETEEVNEDEDIKETPSSSSSTGIKKRTNKA